MKTSRFSFRSPKMRVTGSNRGLTSLFALKARKSSLEDIASDPRDEHKAKTRTDHDEEEEEDDERRRIQIHRRRASSAPLPPTKTVEDEDEDEEEEEEEPHTSEEDDDEDVRATHPMPSDVLALQEELRLLERAKADAEHAWRQENTRLRTLLAAAKDREAKQQSHVEQLEDQLEAYSLELTRQQLDKPSGARSSTASCSTSSSPSANERVLLRLLVQIVGKEPLRALLAQTSPSTTPAQLRRRLITQTQTLRRRQPPASDASISPPSTSSASPPRLPRPSTKQYEMSDAM
ncbi:hypothetical protein Poli38472_004621 [Pythium oligandrum]|uniref:Uncharacterized protein n=1 Tax=Pythium oligandrum TaxID=41045 RepID=A0A8K1FHB0_PYTOL|nr:hypothetical protein Poli38472_004621 [Pythium oligandrum]|eukprot:TMW59552.1 hypothetical protein Poli38472_004621 [Pythium oligandrum]